MVQGIGMSFNVTRAPERTRSRFRLLVAGDFAGRTDSAYEPPRRVTRDNFSDTLGAWAAQLMLDVPNQLAAQPAQLTVTIPLADLSDLTPAGIIAHSPELTTLYLFTQRVQMYLNNELNAAEFTRDLAAYESLPALRRPIQICRDTFATPTPPKATPAAADDTTQRILDLVSGTLTSKPGGLDAVFSSVGGGSAGNTRTRQVLSSVANDVFTLLNNQINAVLRHPALRQAETTWRGLRFLLDHVQEDNVEVLLLDTPREHLAIALSHALDETAAGAAIINFDFSTTAVDVTMLQRVGEAAQGAQTPAIFSVTPDFFGTVTRSGLPWLGTLLDQPQFTGWNALRDKDCARWLCGTFNRFLLREPYTPENTRGLTFTESLTHGNGPVWGSAAWIVAALIARSVTLTHWPTQITGMQHGAIDRLPLHDMTRHDGTTIRLPVEMPLSMQNAEDLAQSGLASVLGQPNRDTAWIMYAPTLRRAQREAERISLPYQLFAARVIATLRAQRSELPESASSDTTAQAVQTAMNELLADTGPEHRAQIRLEPDPDHADRHFLELDLHAGRDILNGASVQMTMPL